MSHLVMLILLMKKNQPHDTKINKSNQKEKISLKKKRSTGKLLFRNKQHKVWPIEC